jgi:hypothetical protein
MADESTSVSDLILHAARSAASDAPLDFPRGPVEPDRQAKLGAELARLGQEPERARTLVTALFPSGVPLDAGLYDRLSRFHFWLGLGGPIEPIVAAAWIATLSGLREGERQTALAALPNTGQDFFTFLDCLADVVAAIPLPPEFVTTWFAALLRRLGDDGATHGFWKAVERYCEVAPAAAVTVLEKSQSVAGSDLHDEIAERLAGTLRTIELGAEQQRFDAAVALLEKSHDPARRRLWVRSWIHSAWRGGMSLDALNRLLAAPGTAEEMDDRFRAVCRILLAPLTEDCFAVALEWMRRNASPQLSAQAKGVLVQVCFALATRPHADARLIAKLWEAILAIQPIDPEHVGTWGRVQDFLGAVMNADITPFEKMLLELCEKSGAALLRLVNSSHGLDGLLSRMVVQRSDELIARLVFAPDLLCRRIGLFFFEKLGAHAFPTDKLAAVSDEELRLALFSFQAASPYGEFIARFLLALLPRVDTAGGEIQREFADELLLQCKNFPSACLDALKASGSKSPLVADVIAKADAYFDAYRPTRGKSPLNSMLVPGLAFIARSKRRAIHREIAEGAERGSIFAQFMKNVDVLYGDRFCSFAEGHLDDPTPMQEHAYDMETPRIEEIDPERMAMRRWHALETTARIENSTADNS